MTVDAHYHALWAAHRVREKRIYEEGQKIAEREERVADEIKDYIAYAIETERKLDVAIGQALQQPGKPRQRTP